MIDALEGYTTAPRAAVITLTHKLDDAGYRVVHFEECKGILSDLIRTAEQGLPEDQRDMNATVLAAKAFLGMLEA